MKINLHPDRRVLRQFAWASLIMFPAIAGFLAWRHDLPTTWVFALCGVGITVALVELVLAETTGAFGRLLEKLIPRALFQLLTLVAAPIGFVLSHVVMAAIYYLVMTPIALVFRSIGRDVIGKRPDRQRTSYWRDRGPERRPAAYFKLY
ncbi:MAG: hypothetical protein KF830_05615 [Planctomycetes bacterium]|nr:hypothetical protein [Planctomycetota bacterium]